MLTFTITSTRVLPDESYLILDAELNGKAKEVRVYDTDQTFPDDWNQLFDTIGRDHEVVQSIIDKVRAVWDANKDHLEDLREAGLRQEYANDYDKSPIVKCYMGLSPTQREYLTLETLSEYTERRLAGSHYRKVKLTYERGGYSGSIERVIPRRFSEPKFELYGSVTKHHRRKYSRLSSLVTRADLYVKEHTEAAKAKAKRASERREKKLATVVIFQELFGVKCEPKRNYSRHNRDHYWYTYELVVNGRHHSISRRTDDKFDFANFTNLSKDQVLAIIDIVSKA